MQRMRNQFAVCALLLVLALPAFSEEEEGYTRFLIPVTAVAVHGANGSIWTTEWTLYNATAQRLYVTGPFPFLSLSPAVQDNEVDAGETKRLVLYEAAPGFDGAFIYLPDDALQHLSMILRARDISVHAQSYGANIPIVRLSEFRPQLRLIDIPADSDYRATLRVYGSTPDEQIVHIRAYVPEHATPMEEFDVIVRANEHLGFEELPRPAYAQLDPLSSALRAAGARVRLEITAASDSPVWAFVTISHNETQQVTTVLP